MKGLGLALVLAGGSAAVAAPPALRIVDVQVQASGRFVRDPNSQETAADCARFRPSAAALRRWFSRARRVPQPQWLEEGDYSPCRANGVVRTRDGRRLAFEIGRGGQARITVSRTAMVYLLGPELP